MKAFVFASVLLALAAVLTCGTLASDPKAEMEEHRKECLVESKVDEAKVIKIRKDHIFPDDEGLQKYFYCILSKEGIIDASGNMNKEVALSKSPNKEEREKDSVAYDTCLDQKGTPIEKVYLMSKCYVGIRPDADFI